MLDHAFAGFIGQVEAREIMIALFQLGYNAVALRVVVKSTVISHQGVERIFSGMAKGRVA